MHFPPGSEETRPIGFAAVRQHQGWTVSGALNLLPYASSTGDSNSDVSCGPRAPTSPPPPPPPPPPTAAGVPTPSPSSTPETTIPEPESTTIESTTTTAPTGIVVGPITCGATVAGSTVDGTSLHGNPAADKAYSFTVGPSGASYTFSTCGSGYDTFVRVYAEDWTQLAENDDSCGLQSVVTVELQPGNYYALVEGYSRAEGEYTLSMASSTGDCAGEPEAECPVGYTDVADRPSWPRPVNRITDSVAACAAECAAVACTGFRWRRNTNRCQVFTGTQRRRSSSAWINCLPEQ